MENASLKRRTKKSWLVLASVAMVTLLLAWVIYALYTGLTQNEFGENTPSVSWLPKSASNVSYHLSYMVNGYEFDMPHGDFMKYAEDEGWQLRQLKDESVEIPSYIHAARFRDLPPDRHELPAQPTNDEMKAFELKWEAFYANRSRTVTNGYAYERRLKNGGGVRVGYDMLKQRAYVFYTPR